MNRHPLSVIDVPCACPGKASLLARALAAPASKLDSLIRFPRLCPLMGEQGGMMDVMGRISRGGCHPCPAWGC